MYYLDCIASILLWATASPYNNMDAMQNVVYVMLISHGCIIHHQLLASLAQSQTAMMVGPCMQTL